MMERVRTSETSVYSNETTRHYIPEGSNLDTHDWLHWEVYRRNYIRSL